MTRNELYAAVWSQPMHVVAARLGISDNGLAKLCKRVGVPSPYRGYWRQMSTGNAPPIPPLPDPADDRSIALPQKIAPVPPNAKKGAGSAAASRATSPPTPDRVTELQPKILEHEGEYQKLIEYSLQLADYHQVGRVLSELALRLPAEADQVATVAARWLDVMRAEHSKRNPVDQLMADLRDQAARRS